MWGEFGKCTRAHPWSDVCQGWCRTRCWPPVFSITLKCNLFCRVPQETWCLQLWLASFSIFSTQVLLPLPVFVWRFLHRKSQSLLSALQQQPWVPTFHLILYWHDLLQLQGAINKYTITGVWQDRPFKYNTYSKIFTQFMGMQAKICWSNTCTAQGNACIQLTCCSVVVLLVAN